MNSKWLNKMLFAIGIWGTSSAVMTVLYKKANHTHKNGFDGIALTFDDGPHPLYTPKLLDLLKKYDVKATFFVVGQQAQLYPEIIQRMQEEGHAIGIHHYRHTSNWLMTPFASKKEIEKCANIIHDITGVVPVLYRPPWGHVTPFTALIAKRYRIVLWTRHFSDWRTSRIQYTLKNELIKATKDGSIFLLHDNGQTIGANEDAPHYMLHHLESYLRQVAHTTNFVVLR